MKKATKTRLAAFACLLALTASQAACGKTKDNTTVSGQAAEIPVVSYQIAVCRSYDSPVYDMITAGFADAISDSAGKAQITLNDRTLQPGESGEAVVLGMLSADNELVFAVGESALSAAAAATTVTPIVGAGVINYQDTLHLLSKNGSWDRLTGRNVTGISAAPFIPDQLSLLIEATPDLRTVGILYSPVDNNAIYQNEMLEDFLDQAGIPWKEYEIAETEEALAEDSREAADTVPTVILPTTVVAASGKEGPNIEVEDIGEDGSLTGINSPESTRTAKISRTWTGGKAVLIAEEEAALTQIAPEDASAPASDLTDPSADGDAPAEDSGNSPANGQAGDDSASNGSGQTGGNSASNGSGQNINGASAESSDPALSEDPDSEAAGASDMTPEEVVSLACEECSVLYISAESRLTDQIDMITRLATDSGVSTIGGDLTLGEKTLACLYSDPYDQGYRAGKVACRILIDGEDASEIKIGQPKDEDLQKLYQDSVADSLGISFPKSFADIDEFLATYVPGTYTKRVSKDE